MIVAEPNKVPSDKHEGKTPKKSPAKKRNAQRVTKKAVKEKKVKKKKLDQDQAQVQALYSSDMPVS